jgi:hypothetical protein
MPKPKVTKTLSLDQSVVKTVEKIAQQEHRSFTKQVELMLEKALGRLNNQPAAAAL